MERKIKNILFNTTPKETDKYKMLPNSNQQAIVVEAKEGIDQDTFLHYANEYSKINKKLLVPYQTTLSNCGSVSLDKLKSINCIPSIAFLFSSLT